MRNLAAIWILIILLFTAPISVMEMSSLDVRDELFDTSGRDSDYCESYSSESSCNSDSLCEWDDDECEDRDDDDDDDDYCEIYDDDPQGCANDARCESEYDDGEHECDENEDYDNGNGNNGNGNSGNGGSSGQDSDNDGMPDAWETKYGLDPTDASDASSDRDNDGVTALNEFLAGTVPQGSIDIDGNEKYDALTDGLLLLRGMFGLDGNALVLGTVGDGAIYSDSADIESRIALLGDLADIDANGQVDPLSDGLLIVRYLFGLEGATLINGVIATDATRTTSDEIEAQLQTLMP